MKVGCCLYYTGPGGFFQGKPAGACPLPPGTSACPCLPALRFVAAFLMAWGGLAEAEG